MPKQTQVSLSTGDLARLTGIPQQTLITWDRAGTLKAKLRAGASPRSERRYDQNGLIAALFARHITRMGFKGSALKEMVGLMQSGNRQRLGAAALVSYRSLPGLIGHAFLSDRKGKDDQRYIEWLREESRLIDSPTDLWAIRNSLRELVPKLVSEDL